MLERSHLESYICYCKYQKNLNNKTLKAYRIDFMAAIFRFTVDVFYAFAKCSMYNSMCVLDT